LNEQIGEKTNFVVGLKRPKINKEEAKDGPFEKQVRENRF